MQSISYFLLLTALFLTSPLNSQSLSSLNPKNPNFISPLDIPLLLSANYGEYRTGHFHAGIDFKTQQVEGKNVFAVDSGYVYRIVVLAASYGNAVYLKHASGHITLYGHLSRFEPSIEKYVRDQQYRKKSFTVDLYPEPGRFILRKGAYLGLSGNSGMSFGAHLHFEVRDQSGAIPLNPLNYGFDVQDKIRPEIHWLKIYSLDTGSSVNGIRQNLLLKTSHSRSGYRISPDTLKIRGTVGLGIETYDFLDNALNQCGPNTIEVFVDNQRTFFIRLDSIPFSAGGYIYSYFDYGELLRSGRKIQKLYIDPNNKLSVYKLALNRGILRFDDAKVHAVRIVVTDTYGNASDLRMNLQSVIEPPVMLKAEPDSLVVNRFYYDSLNVYENQHIRIVLPKDALFDHIDFQYAEWVNDSIPYSLIHKVHNRYTPVFAPYILSIRPRDLPVSLQGKALIASRAANGTWTSQGGEYKNDFVTARVKVFGDFIIMVDSVPPVIKPVAFTAKARYSAGQLLTFTIADSLSGIRNYTGFIDGIWALFEYDAKNDLLSYAIDSRRITGNALHEIEILVTDHKGNMARFKSSFYF